MERAAEVEKSFDPEGFVYGGPRAHEKARRVIALALDAARAEPPSEASGGEPSRWAMEHAVRYFKIDRFPRGVVQIAALAKAFDAAALEAKQDWTAEAWWKSPSSPDDLRQKGWAVVVHHDYRQDGLPRTFWLLTNGDRRLSGEGRTDAEALNQIRAQVGIQVGIQVGAPDA
jgi:hypothetical protein